MTVIYNITPGFLQAYVTYQSKKDISMEEIFKRLSYEMGGDGKSITKKELDNYIKNYEASTKGHHSPKLSALKIIQKNWDTISHGKDSITFEDMKDYSTLLAAIFAGDFTATEVDDSTDSAIDAVLDYLADYLGLSSKDDLKKSDLTSYLNELITNSSEENDVDGELIGALTNAIATFDTNTTVETEA